MNNKSFPNHSGGVIQVWHRERYGIVPEALLEDSRLRLDSRAVAAWLSVKPDGWVISITNLRCRLALEDKEMLGKDRWQTIANELESAGYLSRKKLNGEGGKWNWQIIFNPAPEKTTVDGSADSGAAKAGSTCGGESGHKVIPIKELTNITTTTNERVEFAEATEKDRSGGLDNLGSIHNLHFPQATRNELESLKRVIARCRPSSRQDVLDEIEGIRRSGALKGNVVQLAQGLVKKVGTNQFNLSAGLAERNRREASVRYEKALKNEDSLAICLKITEKTMSALPPNIARKTREVVGKSVDQADGVRAVESRRSEDGKVDGSIEGSIDENIDGSIDENIDGSIDENIDGSIDENIDGSIDENIDGSIDENIDGSIDENIDENIDGTTPKLPDRMTDVRTK